MICLRLTFGSICVLAACSKPPSVTASVMPAASAAASGENADAAVTTTEVKDASVEAMVVPPPKRVLHAGDSTVGGYGGLAKALDERFTPLGAKFVRDWQTSISIQMFDKSKRLSDLIKEHNPELVILTLGANDIADPFPDSLASTITSIARKASTGRICYWMTPPVSKPDTGITEAIKRNATGCNVFDSSGMKIGRAHDGIHPTDQGGAAWAEKFWAFYEQTWSDSANHVSRDL